MSLFTIPPSPGPRAYKIVGTYGKKRVQFARYATSEALRIATRLRALGWTVTVTS